MDFVDSLKQIKSDILENNKKKEKELEIQKKEEELKEEFLSFMEDVKQISKD